MPARQRILLTAHDLFYQQGIRATGIDRVIADAGVTKVTFYRHFPSKNDLIRAFLDYRHQVWMSWFTGALRRHGNGLSALVPTLREWFGDPGFRGCAFINSVAEVGASLPEVLEITRQHKEEMTQEIAGLLPPPLQPERDALVIALAVDGAIIHAQFDGHPDAALRGLELLIEALLRAPA